MRAWQSQTAAKTAPPVNAPKQATRTCGRPLGEPEMVSPIVFTGLTLDQANATAKFQSDRGAKVTVKADGAGTYTVEVTELAPGSGQPAAIAPPTFSQVADAMRKIIAQLNADQPPSLALKQSLTAANQKLLAAVDAIASADVVAAAAAVGDAAKQLQDIRTSLIAGLQTSIRSSRFLDPWVLP